MEKKKYLKKTKGREKASDKEMEIDSEMLEHRSEVNENSEDEMEGFEAEKLLAAVSKNKSGGFQALGLSHNILKGIQKKGYKQPTPIQRKAIPVILQGQDVVAMARTGSGKTAAFLLPLFERLKAHSAVTGARALIIAPTRELAVQTHRFCKDLGKFTDLQSVVILGGDALEDQFAAMHENPDIIIGTPGRLLHLIMEMNLKLKTVEYVVFDEADRLFEMGFQEQMTETLNRLPDVRQTVLFSATLPRLLVDFARAGLKDPILIRLNTDSKLPDTLKTVFWVMRDEDKYPAVIHLVRTLLENKQLTVVFVPTKHHVEYLKEIFEKAGIPCSCVYSSLDQQARKIAVASFKSKIVRIMLVTDVAARGIDIPLLDHVINFSFPAKPKLFVHRVGRVARAGRFGTAFSFVSPDEAAYLQDLHLFLDTPLKFSDDNMTEDESGVTGSVPELVFDEERSFLDSLHKTSVELMNMKRVCSNALQQYRKSRPTASAESNKRMKSLLKETLPLHPIFRKDSIDSARESMIEACKKFKPSATIFEIGNTGKTDAATIMKKKRQTHDTLIEKMNSDEKEKGSYGLKYAEPRPVSTLEAADEDVISKVFAEATKHRLLNVKKRVKPDSFRDEKFYIPHVPSNHHFERGLGLDKNFSREIQSEVLDLLGEDVDDIRKNKRQMKWDRKKKRFVLDDDGSDPKNKKIRTESGVLVPASYKKDLYKQWKQKNNIDYGATYNSDEEQEGDMFGKQKLFRRELGVNQRFQPKLRRVTIDEKTGKPVKSELKRPEVILKELKRKKKIKFQQKMAKKNREQGTRRKKFKR
ncbi:ATP-dependent RNA helicase DDX54-like isoform X1 [Varroa jacobsoni]|uniref:ATP-dependent RNA helicase DDX54-like isoform X1 n=1 Tax=Varroa jacobsoni TaxID=62625 RepID=UPI000BF6ABE2|nr:ATP-dependent RNA helicase DDX54-like isoform X1 [Varroa jacobsoni]